MKKALLQISNYVASAPKFQQFFLMSLLAIYFVLGGIGFTILMGLGQTIWAILGYVSMLLTGIIWWNAFPEETEQEEQQTKSNKGWIWFSVFGIGVIVFLLFFHLVPERLMVFPKASPTFKNTWITNDDITKLVEQYNSASFLEKQQLENDPYTKTLLDNGVIQRIK